MTAKKPIKHPHHHGYADLGMSRYFALYVAQAGWFALGFLLFSRAYWPSACQPTDFLQVYQCSIRLPEGRGWVESSLMTWLWSTPLLIILEIQRRFRNFSR